jgi:hypothetical protein
MATRKANMRGGKRGKSRKIGKKAGEWSKKVMAVYRELKAKRKDVRLMDAMKEASRRKAAGTL